MKLLITGNIALAGAAKRQAIEAISLTLLFSKRDLPYLRLAWEKKFSENKAIEKVIKHQRELKLNSDALELMKMSRNFYHKHSHATIFSMSDTMNFDVPGTYYLGSSFDKGKLEAYQFEIKSRVSLANILINLIVAVTRQMKEWPVFSDLGDTNH